MGVVAERYVRSRSPSTREEVGSLVSLTMLLQRLGELAKIYL